VAPGGAGSTQRRQRLTSTPSVTRVAEALGLDRRHWPWLRRLAALPSGPRLEPLAPDPVGGMLTDLGVDPATVADTVATIPTPDRDPERWWLVERCQQLLVDTMADLDADVGRWPDLPGALGAAGRCFPLHWYVATVPATRRWHAAHGVSCGISKASLSDLARHARIGRSETGHCGLDAAWWMTRHVRALLYEVGGLQYVPFRFGSPAEQPDPWCDPAAADRLGPGLRPGDTAVGLHVPAGADLRPEQVERSMAAAADLFDRLVPSPHPRVLTCSSWLLDEVLADLLPPDSAIVALARRFTLVPGALAADRAVLAFVFTKRGVAPTRAGATTRLQRAVLDHLEAGGHFSWRSGWSQFPARVTFPWAP